MRDAVLIFVFTAAMFALAIVIGRVLERLRPIEPEQPRRETLMDYKLVAVNLLLTFLASPLTGICAAMIIYTAGGGFIPLDGEGWWFPLCVIGYLLVYDLFLYTWHRAQHTVPALWAMHSLHHSARALSVSTSGRHYWLEGVLKGALILPVVGILFRTPPAVSLTAVLIYFIVDACAHMNIRVELRRLALFVNNPQFHRIHHSIQDQHLNKNFSDLLPIWDVIFGTAWTPKPGEWPATGLARNDSPANTIDGVFWPIRNLPLAHWGKP